MAGKWNRTIVGSIVKSKDPKKANYVKVNLFGNNKNEVLLRNGDFLQLQTNTFRKNSLEEDLKNGRIDEAKYEQLMSKITSQPDFVLGNLVLVRPNSDEQ